MSDTPNSTTQDEEDRPVAFEIEQRSLDGGRPRGQLTLTGGIVEVGGGADCD